MMEYKKICSLTTVVTGGTPSTNVSEYWEGGNIPWLQSGCCQNCDVEYADKYITQSGYDNSSTKRMPPDTIMIALTGATAGKVGYLKFDACGNQSITGILPCNTLDQRYLFYYLISQRSKILADCIGGAQPHISQGYVKDILIPVLSLDEQKRISKRFSEVDNLIFLRKQQLSKLDELVRSRFVEMFENGNFTLVKAEDVCEFITKGTTPPTGEIYTEFGDNRIPYIKVYNLSFDGSLLFDCAPQYIDKSVHNGKLSRSKVYPNDVLMNIVGPPLGKFSLVTSAFAEWNINQAISIFRAKNDVLPRFLLSALMQPTVLEPFLKQAVGVRQLNISLEQCRNLQFPLPPIELQAEFVSFAEQTDKLKVTVQKSLEKLETLKKALMQKYFG